MGKNSRKFKIHLFIRQFAKANDGFFYEMKFDNGGWIDKL